MRMGLYSINDACGGFQQVYTFQTNMMAIRWFYAACMAKDGFAAVKDDLTLCRVGEIDLETGIITPESNPIKIAMGRDVEVKNEE